MQIHRSLNASQCLIFKHSPCLVHYPDGSTHNSVLRLFTEVIPRRFGI